MAAHTFNRSTREAEVGGSLSMRQPDLHSEFLDSQGYTKKLCLEKQTSKQTKVLYCMPLILLGNFSLLKTIYNAG